MLGELDIDGVRQRSGRPFDKVVLHKILKNRTYRGLTVNKKEAYPGKHEAIIREEPLEQELRPWSVSHPGRGPVLPRRETWRCYAG